MQSSSAPLKSSLHDGIRGRVAVSLFVSAGLGLAIFGWASVAQLSGAVVTSGSVVADKNAQKVQHREGGVVSEIRVRNGVSVQAGDVLLRLDDTQLRAELGMVRAQLVELSAKQARLLAERDDAPEIKFPDHLQSNPAAAQSRSGELRLFAHAQTVRKHQKNQLAAKQQQLQHEASGYRDQLMAKSVELNLVEQELGKVVALAEKGIASQARVVSLKRDQARALGEAGNLNAAIARSEVQVSEVKLQMLAIDETVRTEAQKELRQIDAKVSELSERELVAADRLQRIDVRAPVAGVVHELTTHTVGGVLNPGETAMVIVPLESQLAVEIKLPPGDINRVRLGQDVRLRFTSFNQRTTPEVSAKLAFVSADVSRDGGRGPEFFTARATFLGTDQPSLAGRQLMPGMPVEAFISTESRSALSYFLKPMTDHFARALREE